jgi:hypothetical protein
MNHESSETVPPDDVSVTGPATTAEGAEGPLAAEEAEETVSEPAKVMRIGSMIKQLLEEVRQAPLDDRSRVRLKAVFERSVEELGSAFSPDLRRELDALALPFADDEVPSDAELRIAQAQLVGWLEGLFHGIQASVFAQQMAMQAQMEARQRGLPPGAVTGGAAPSTERTVPGGGTYL